MEKEKIKPAINPFSHIPTEDKTNNGILRGKTPYSFDITNDTDEPKEARLFGKNKFIFAKNYGSEEGLKIVTKTSNSNYETILNGVTNSDIVLVRLFSDNINQLKQKIKVTTEDEELQSCTLEFDSEKYYSDEYPQEHINEVLVKYKQDENTYVSITILPKTTLGIRFYESKKTIKHWQEDIREYSKNAPNQFIVTNNTDDIKKAVIYGFNEMYNKPNYGSDTQIEISTTQQNLSYSEVLADSIIPFNTCLIRLQSSNHKQIIQDLCIVTKHACGTTGTEFINSESYFSKYQHQKGILDIPYEYVQDGNTKLCMDILPKTTMIITIFKEQTVDFFNKKWELGIEEKLLYQLQLNNNLTQRLEPLENKKSWWQKWFSKSK